jgi:excisionase family DNA binding protein
MSRRFHNFPLTAWMTFQRYNIRRGLRLMATTPGTFDQDGLPPRPTVKQAAEFLGVNEKTIRNRLADRSLAGYRVGPRSVRVDRDSLIALASRPLIPAYL